MAKWGRCIHCGAKWKECWKGWGQCCEDCEHPEKADA